MKNAFETSDRGAQSWSGARPRPSVRPRLSLIELRRARQSSAGSRPSCWSERARQQAQEHAQEQARTAERLTALRSERDEFRRELAQAFERLVSLTAER